MNTKNQDEFLPPSVSNLNYEVLIKIFSYLSLSDRKNARLVLHSWYVAGSHSSITKNEKFVLTNEENKKKKIKVLSKCGYNHLNIEFFGVDIDKSSVSFWKKNGYRIFSLSFVNCRFKNNAALKIMYFCTEVQDMAFEKCTGFFSVDNFIYCRQKKIIRSNLTSMDIKYDDHINDYLFNEIFKVYPEVKSIGVCLRNDRSYNSTYKHIYRQQNLNTMAIDILYDSEYIFSHSAIYSRFDSSSSFLEGIKYREVDKDVCRLHCSLFQAIRRMKDLKLKVFQYDPSSFNIPPETALKSFFCNQTELEVVKLKKVGFSNNSFEILLNHCRNLNHLELEDINNVDTRSFETVPILLNHNLIDKMVSSKLKCLKLHFDFHFEEPEHDFFHTTSKNHSLEELSINSRTILRSEIFLFLEIFRRILYLDLKNCCVDDSLMQIISNYQVNLVSLNLRYNEGITDFGLVGKSPNEENRIFHNHTYSINRLESLINLDLKDCKHITSVTLSELFLPQLKYLSLSNCNQISDDAYLSIIKICPLLEYLDLSHTLISVQTLQTIRTSMDRLHFLDVTCCDNIDEESVNRILKINNIGQLRFLIHTLNAYAFDIFKKKWYTTDTSIWLEMDGKSVHKNYIIPPRPKSAWKKFLSL